MNNWKIVAVLAASMIFAGQLFAQTSDEGMRAAEAREAEMEQRLKEAELSMEEAARQILEITAERLPGMLQIEKHIELSDKPRLGISIDSERQSGPVEGVVVMAVSPGSAASDAGLRSGDTITAINSETLSADSAAAANRLLLDFMEGVEAGDVLTLEYLRDGKVGSVEVEPRAVTRRMFSWRGDDGPHAAPGAPHPPGIVEKFRMQFGFPWTGTSLGELELVELNEGLGRYFGTDTGLLVVRAPGSDAFDLQEGDVIQSIDGREPRDVRHAMRILGSYQSGEKLKLGIMRDKKKRTLEVEIPADQHGALIDELLDEILPARAPTAPAAPPESSRT